jgi:Ankyrin repeat
MLKKMVRLYPQSLITLVHNKEYTLPIQLAYSCTDDVPDEEEWLQEAIPILTPPSCSPMLFCCNQGCSLDLVKYIQEKLDPDCCTRFHSLVTNGGVPFHALPLHIACMSANPDLSVLQWLVQNNPSAVSFKLQGLFYPLQCLFKSKQLPANSEINFGAVEYIVNQYPAVIKERDYQGMLPIQVAVTTGASLSVIYHLLRMAPDDMVNVFQHPTSSSSSEEAGGAAVVASTNVQ